MKNKPKCQLPWHDSKCGGKILQVIVDSNATQDISLYACYIHNLLYRAVLKLHKGHKIPLKNIKELTAEEIVIKLNKLNKIWKHL